MGSKENNLMPPPQNQGLPPSPSNIDANNSSVNSPAKRVSPAYSDISDASNSPTPINQESNNNIQNNSQKQQPHQQKTPNNSSPVQNGQKMPSPTSGSNKPGTFGPPPKLQSAPGKNQGTYQKPLPVKPNPIQ